tara:strand:- start:306 stop:1583 length:1278 start_codon:yes stop_codon:yes gene_type:complete
VAPQLQRGLNNENGYLSLALLTIVSYYRSVLFRQVWRIKIKFLIIVSFLFIHNVAATENFTLPKSFEDGEVAEAVDFNNNFEAIRDEINMNAPWRNHDVSGVLEIEVNCSNDVNALRTAFQANMDADNLSFVIEGSCATALFNISATDSEGVVSWTVVQPKNKVVEFRGKDEDSFYTLLPVNVDGREITNLYASFGTGYYFRNAIIQMGADDKYGVLYSRNSNGGLTNSKIIGKGADNPGATGVIVQYGASAYFMEVEVSEVAYGVYVRQAGSLRTYQLDVSATTRAMFVLNGGKIESRGGLKLKAPQALWMNGGSLNGSVAYIQGSINLFNATVDLEYDYGGGTLDSDVAVNWSRLTIVTDPNSSGDVNNLPSLTESVLSSRFTCYGLSFLDIDSLDVRNQGDKKCLDNAGWNQIIKASFPQAY